VRWFRVIVTDTNTGKNKVSVRLPMRLVRWKQKVAHATPTSLEGIDMDELAEALAGDGDGQLVTWWTRKTANTFSFVE
jgi:hypothetical protein